MVAATIIVMAVKFDISKKMATHSKEDIQSWKIIRYLFGILVSTALFIDH